MPQNKINKKETKILFLLALIALVGAAFFVIRFVSPEKNTNPNKPPEAEDSERQLYPKITVDELKNAIISGQPLILLDVQSHEDYLTATLPQTISIPLDELNDRLKELPKNKTIITLDGGEGCDSCARAVEILIASGYTDVKKLDGGITTWAEAGYPVATGKDITIKNIGAQELKDMITLGDQIVIIDVREQAEYAAGHVKNAKNIPFAGVTKNLQDITRDKTIVIYDQAGNRSPIVVEQLIREGYLNTLNLLSGYEKWQEAGYETE